MFLEYYGSVFYDESWKYMVRHRAAVTLGSCLFPPSSSALAPADSRIHFREVIKCTNWPVEMKQWFDRQRWHPWPNEELRRKVLRSGCLIVARPGSKFTSLWEISLSQAEQILVNAFNRVQQTVYQMLMIFHTAELNCENYPYEITKSDLLSLMFCRWEEKPSEFWEENSVISICCLILSDLRSRLSWCELKDYFFGHNHFAWRWEDSDVQKMVEQVRALLKRYSEEDKLGEWVR